MPRKPPWKRTSTGGVTDASLTSVRRNVWRSVSLAMLLVACGGTAAARTAVVPEPADEAAPAQEIAAQREGSPEPGSSPRQPLAESALRVTVRVPLTTIAQSANESAPRVLANERWGVPWLPVSAGYRVTRGRIVVRGRGDAIEWSVPVELAGRADPIGGCDASLTATVSTRLSLGPDLRLASESSPGSREWRRRCRLLGVDLTSVIDPPVLAAQAELARQIDERVAEQGLPIEALWARLNERVELPDGFGLWLRPARLAVSELRATDDAIEVLVEVGVRPIVTMHTPADAAPRPLPEATRITIDDRSFRVRAELEVPMESIEEEVLGIARGELAPMGVTVDRATVVSTAEGLSIGLTITSPIALTIWFAADIGFDERTGRLTISRVRVSETTRQMLASAGLDPAFVEEELGMRVTVPDERVEALREQLRAAIATPITFDGHGELSVEPSSIELAGVFHSPELVGVAVDVAGTAVLVVDPP
jgi:hypothetical protein